MLRNVCWNVNSDHKKCVSLLLFTFFLIPAPILICVRYSSAGSQALGVNIANARWQIMNRIVVSYAKKLWLNYFPQLNSKPVTKSRLPKQRRKVAQFCWLMLYKTPFGRFRRFLFTHANKHCGPKQLKEKTKSRNV